MRVVKNFFQHTSFIPMFFGVMAIVIWACAPALIKIGSTEAGVSEFLFARYAVCALLFSPMIHTLWKKRKGITLKSWGIFFISITIHIILQLYCLRFIPVSWYIVIFSLCPFFTLLLMRVRLSYKMISCVALAALGTLAFINPTDLTHFPPLYGLFAAIGTTIAWAIFTVKIVAFQQVYTDFQISALSTLLLFISATILSVSNGLNFSTFSSSMFISTTLLAISMPLAFVFFSFCLRRLPIFGVTSQYLEFVLGVGIGVIFFREAFTVFQLIGSFMVLAGILLLSRMETQKNTA